MLNFIFKEHIIFYRSQFVFTQYELKYFFIILEVSSKKSRLLIVKFLGKKKTLEKTKFS